MSISCNTYLSLLGSCTRKIKLKMANAEEAMQTDEGGRQTSKGKEGSGVPGKLFTLKKWNAVAMWSWDVECETCAICRVQVRILLGPILASTTLDPIFEQCPQISSIPIFRCKLTFYLAGSIATKIAQVTLTGL